MAATDLIFEIVGRMPGGLVLAKLIKGSSVVPQSIASKLTGTQADNGAPTEHKILWDADDTLVGFTRAGGDITVNAAGRYLAAFTLAITGQAGVGGGYVIFKNGASVLYSAYLSGPLLAAVGYSIAGSLIFDAAVSDSLALYWQPVLGGGTSLEVNTKLYIEKLHD